MPLISKVNLNQKVLANFKRDSERFMTLAPEGNLQGLLQKYSRIYAAAIERRKERNPEDGERNVERPTPPIKSETCLGIIRRPFAQEVHEALGFEGHETLDIAGPQSVLDKGKKLHNYGTTVTLIDRNVVVKAGCDLDLAEALMMDHISQNTHDIPLLKHLGSVTSQRMTYIFMSSIPGKSLREPWPTLEKEQKLALRDQLSQIFRL
ncbi:hypothetical protein M501DRAFT_1034963 [Patellaria atrata CBS 101060]|uniref:Uncharacterized protein n=1 Tax=Patellaria atrata CBS 101060 TaxID=1346257 RepID=A0A9P4S3S9_9PEZI|nr:hypothetical protein M501DRAFT_1034963 [Patellaria atrata CBS 101060]